MRNKKFLIILIIAVIIFGLGKIYCLTIMKDMYNAVENFRSTDNRYYSVEEKILKNTSCKKEIFIKENSVKYIKNNGINEIIYEWKNFETNEHYLYNSNNEILDNKELSIEGEGFIKNLPNFISVLCQNGKFNLASVMKVNYIIPTKYNNKPCYKVVTKAETIIIDKDTYLPIYSAMTTHNSSVGDKVSIEKTYEFEVGNVTDEDMLLPDFTNYTVVENFQAK